MRVYFSAGEASGDAYAAALAVEIRRLCEHERHGLVERALQAQVTEWNVSFRTSQRKLDLTLEMMTDVGLIDFDEPEWNLSFKEAVDLIVKHLADEPLPEWIFGFEGVGGKRLIAEANGKVLDSSKWGAISISQVLAMAPRFIFGYLRAKRQLKRGVAGLFIPIDFGYFNIRLAKVARQSGWKVLYFVPPGSWRRDKQGKDLPALTDAIVTPFPWSAEMLNAMGADAHFFGHPIKQLIRDRKPVASETAIGKTIAVLPGSRKHEIGRNLPLIADCLLPALERQPDSFQVEFAVAPTADLENMRAEWTRVAPGRQDIFTVGDTYGVLQRAHAGVVCSGTATLEAALLRLPMVVVYRVTKAMQREYKLIGFKIPEFISLPNILLQRRLVPEFLVGETFDVEAIRAEILKSLTDPEFRATQVAGFDEIDDVLGPNDAITKTAELAAKLCE